MVGMALLFNESGLIVLNGMGTVVVIGALLYRRIIY